MTSEIIPENYVTLFQDKYFLKVAFANRYCTVVGKEGAIGVRYAFGPIAIEYYTGDIEPEILPWEGIRLLFWCRIKEGGKRKGWRETKIRVPEDVYSILEIQRINAYTFFNRTFRTYYGRWGRQVHYDVVQMTSKEYGDNYRKYSLPKDGRNGRAIRTELYNNTYPENTCMYGLKCKETGVVVGGIAVCDFPGANQSYYITAFTRKDIAPPEAGLWLCKRWMEDAKSRGIKYVNFGIMWADGQPKSWKGFSEFKLKFNPMLLRLQKPLFRVTFSVK